jgi:DNA polymerase-4
MESSFSIPQNRRILHIDMNAFFASVEQSANPFIRYKPVAVGSPEYANTALVAVSYEARARGVRNLSRGVEAREACPELIIAPFDPLKYYSVNRQIVKILREYTPQVEVYSIDEAFLDLTHPPKKLIGRDISDIAQEIKQRIEAEVGPKLRSSVGIAPNKLLAKVASDWEKPDGLTVINWEERLKYLDALPIGDIWGIGRSVTPKLNNMGIFTTAQLREVDQQTLYRLVGGYYTRLLLLARGEHYDPVSPQRSQRPHKSMQHAHTLSNATRNTTEILSVIRKMAERLARRLRQHQQRAAVVQLGLKPAYQKEGYGWGSPTGYGGVLSIAFSNHGSDIYEAAVEIFQSFDIVDDIRLIAVGIGDLKHTDQLLLSNFGNPKHEQIDQATDKINNTYGAFTVRTADIVYQYAKEHELSVEKEDMVFHPE